MILFEEISRPVIYEHDDVDFSYWGKGSSFVIASSSFYYWVTAFHVIENTGGNINTLRIFPSDNSQISLPFDEKYIVNRKIDGREDFDDIFILRLNLHEFDESGDAPLVAYDINSNWLDTEQLASGDELCVIGYPSESNFIDYDNRKICSTRSVLRAIYKGKSTSENCHELIFSTSINLNDYDGLSGSPVFYIKQQRNSDSSTNLPILAGMLIRGTVSSKVGHFISLRVIKDILSIVENTADSC